MVCSMIDFMIEIKKKHKSQQRTKLAENLHNHAHAEMLPTNSKFLHFMWSFFSSYRRADLSFQTFSN